MTKNEHLLNFETMPDKLKEHLYSKYKADSISMETHGKVDIDYSVKIAIYKDNDNQVLSKFENYKDFYISLKTNIFQNEQVTLNEYILLPEGLELIVEKLNQKEVIEILCS